MPLQIILIQIHLVKLVKPVSDSQLHPLIALSYEDQVPGHHFLLLHHRF